MGRVRSDRSNPRQRQAPRPSAPRPLEGFPQSLRPLLARIANRHRPRSEATLQADIRQLLLDGDFDLSEHDLDVPLEAPVGGGRRIDIEIGFTAIEVKRSLDSPRALREGERQLADYLRSRNLQTGQRYVGILTDGACWRAYHLYGSGLREVTAHKVDPDRPDGLALFYWLEGVLATRQGIPPTPEEIGERLGATSTSYQLDRAALADLYTEHADTATVQLKRQLWAQLLRSALGTQFVDSTDLFVEHTLLMNSADIIAHLVVGIDVMDLQPATIISGQRFEQAGIFGVVEQDFFDWTIEVPGGPQFVQALARRLARFDWSRVEHDVLKILYESIIGTETRKRMGEYYTPDWLAEHIVERVITRPRQQRVLDPACGSGTFLFHAVRRYLKASEAAGEPLDAMLAQLSRQIIGVDLHPVAVALARVTYLLAIGHERLTDPRRGPVTIPVYLGDSIQWREHLDLFTDDHLRIRAGHGASLYEDLLRFPQHLLDDPDRFDRLVVNLANLAAKPRDKNTVPSLTALFHRMAIADEDQPVIRETFAAMCRLHDESRNHIWNYYIRNLARPVWLAMPENRVDVLLGNPPWLSYRHMPADMQVTFKKLSRDRGLWKGSEVATHQDLSALFVARAIQQYLNVGGSFAFVLPNSVLDRDYFAGFRSGWYDDPTEPTAVIFDGSWDLRRLRPHLFLRGSCVLFGHRVCTTSYRRTPITTEIWSGRLPSAGRSWSSVERYISRQPTATPPPALQGSQYRQRFFQGATIVPRMLFLVEARHSGPLGLGAGRRAVRSARSANEKLPWKHLPPLEGIVEAEFIRPVLLGESVLPFRVSAPREAVIPSVGSHLLSSDDPKLDYYPGLADWWARAEAVWTAHRSSPRLTLTERLDFRRGLTAQMPAPPLRLAYSKSGMHVAAAIVDDPFTIIDHKLYWATITSRQEGFYLMAVLNSPVLTDLVRPLMSYGKDERDIDKHIWKLPIPVYDETNPTHQQLARIGQQQSEAVAKVTLDDSNFVTQRRRIRATLAKHPGSSMIRSLVTELLGQI